MMDKFFRSFSIDDEVKKRLKSDLIVHNVIGMMSVNGGAGASTIVSNVAQILARYNLVMKKKEFLTDLFVCVIDFDVFKPMQYQLLGAKAQKKGVGLKEIFIGNLGAINDNMIRVSQTLSLISASPEDQIYEYFDVHAQSISEMIAYLRDRFDLVIIDIPNIPPAPMCYEAVKNCNKVFLVWDENVNLYHNTKRIMNFFDDIKIRNKFTHVIFNKKTKTPLEANKINELVKSLDLNLLTIIPYKQIIVNDNMRGTMCLDNAISYNSIKKPFLQICKEITQIKLSNIETRGDENEKMDD